MVNSTSSSSPQLYARIGGVAYLIIIVAGLFGELFVRNSIIVAGDAASTAKNIMDHTSLWRAGIAGDLIMHICDVVLMLVFFFLLKPVNRNLALLLVLFNLVQTATLVANKMNLLTPLFLLRNADYLNVFDPKQLQALAYVAIVKHTYGFGVGLIFFGMECLIIGHLIIRSTFFPKVLGILMEIAGACYLINSFALILHPPLADMLFPFILLPPFIAELSLALWLLIKGVDNGKWKERALLSAGQ